MDMRHCLGHGTLSRTICIHAILMEQHLHIILLSAVSTCPRNSQIQIYTDSLSIILKYDKLIKKPLISSKILSLKYWPIWVTLLNYIKSFNLTINFHKVQAHSDNIFNDNADYLAKHYLISPFLELNHTNIYNPYYILQFENFSVE